MKQFLIIFILLLSFSCSQNKGEISYISGKAYLINISKDKIYTYTIKKSTSSNNVDFNTSEISIISLFPGEQKELDYTHYWSDNGKSISHTYYKYEIVGVLEGQREKLEEE